MVVTPDFGQAQPGPDGFRVFKKEFNNLKPGANVQIKASYTKSDPTPSVVSQQQGQGEQSSGQPQQSKGTNASIWLFFAAFVATIGLIIYKAMNSKLISAKLNPNKEKPKNSKLQSEKIKLRDELISCRITEDTYDQLLAELNEEEDS